MLINFSCWSTHNIRIHPCFSPRFGGLIGSAIGSEIGSSATKKDGVELLIKTDAGRFLSIIQEVSDFSYAKGQKIRIIKRNGKSRVIPFE